MKNRHWLWYVKDWEWSESFYKEFEKNIPLLFESQLNKKLNWNRIWLFIPPGTIYEKRIINGKKCFYISEVQLDFGMKWITGKLLWTSKSNSEYISPEDNIEPGDLDFKLDIINDSFKDEFPGPEDTLVLKDLDIKAYFPVKLMTAYIPHDGLFFIELENDDELDNLKTVLYDSFSEWDKEKIVYGIDPNERGLLHNIEYEGKDEKYHNFYYDQGSASYAAFDYIVSRLSDEVKGIKLFIIGRIAE